jgi:hypothetical protein
MTETFKRDAFAEVLGTFFKLPAAEGMVLDLELVEVSESKSHAFQETFSLLFKLPPGYEAPQGLYEMSHEKLGTMHLFLVPIGIEDDRLRLEAIFNLVAKENVS